MSSKGKIIKVEIIETKPSNFYINDIDKDFSKFHVKDFNFQLQAHSSANIKQKLILINLELSALLNGVSKENSVDTFGVKSQTIFRVPDIEKFLNEKREFIIPIGFQRKLLNICVGGLRGMLAVYLSNTKLHHITLPLFDLGDLSQEK